MSLTDLFYFFKNFYLYISAVRTPGTELSIWAIYIKHRQCMFQISCDCLVCLFVHVSLQICSISKQCLKCHSGLVFDDTLSIMQLYFFLRGASFNYFSFAALKTRDFLGKKIKRLDKTLLVNKTDQSRTICNSMIQV